MPDSKSSNAKGNGADQQASADKRRASGPCNGDEATSRPIVHLGEFVAQINARLTAAGTVALGTAQTEPATPVEHMQVIVFLLGGVHYAVDIDHISEVGRLTDITRVPGLADWVLGVINLHGEIVSVVDLTRFLELDTATERPADMMIVAQAGDQKIGLMVDGIEQIFAFPTEQVISPPFKIERSLVHYMRGAVDREGQFIRLLDCERLLLGPQMQQFSQDVERVASARAK